MRLSPPPNQASGKRLALGESGAYRPLFVPVPPRRYRECRVPWPTRGDDLALLYTESPGLPAVVLPGARAVTSEAGQPRYAHWPGQPDALASALDQVRHDYAAVPAQENRVSTAGPIDLSGIRHQGPDRTLFGKPGSAADHTAKWL